MRSVWMGVDLAFRSIGRNRLRAVLTIVGMLIGVAAVVTVTALGAGARDRVSDQIQQMGSNILMVAPQSAVASGARGALGSTSRLTDDDARVIAREAVSVAGVAPALRARAQVVARDRNWSTQVIGSTLAYFLVRNWSLDRGAPWTEIDQVSKAKVCVLGATVASKLFGTEDPTGSFVRLGPYAFKVLGVLQSKGEAAFGGDQDDMILMPIGSMRGRIVRVPPKFTGVLFVSATRPETADRAARQIEAILRQRHHIEDGRQPDFWILTQKEFQQMQASVYSLLTILLVCIAAVSLVVGGIGVMNIMLVSVTERTREIGIRMALGARAFDIMVQFLVEAVTLSALGGLSGALAGVATIAGLGYWLQWPMKLEPLALAIAVATSAATGIVFGFFPARRAAYMDPITALRRE